jgi:ABC-type Mn2+/Zn2+ transport system permease subunit
MRRPSHLTPILSWIWLSYLFNLTSGATIILVAAFFFFASLLIDRLRKQRNLPLP